MTHEELQLLLGEPVREAIEANLLRKPEEIALDKRIDRAALVATQVKYLQRAAKKIPAYYRHRCILPPRAYEQASSEAAARNKTFRGERCLDLTCGLGVDTLSLAAGFRQVVAVEADEVLAAVARENFKRLGIANVEVVHATAEEAVAEALRCGRQFDLIYADPDRRDAAGKKRVRLEDCSPDVVALMPDLQRLAPRIVLKNSPLFEVSEAMRLFGERVRVEVVSLGGECKEVIVETGAAVDTPEIVVTLLGKQRLHFPVDGARKGETTDKTAGNAEAAANRHVGNYANALPSAVFAPPYRYLIVPDVALQKAHKAGEYFHRALPQAWIDSDNGYVFTNALPGTGEDGNDGTPAEGNTGEVPGKVFEVLEMQPYRPKTLKKELAAAGLRRADLLLRNFPFPAETVCRALGIRQGGTEPIAFTRTAQTLWAIRLKRLSL